MKKNDKPKNSNKATNAKAKAAKNKPAEQAELDGFKTKKIPELDTAAESYREARDARMQLTEEETAAKDKLADAMKTHGVKVYKYRDADGVPFTVTLDDEIKVKVKKDKAPKGDD